MKVLTGASVFTLSLLTLLTPLRGVATRTSWFKGDRSDFHYNPATEHHTRGAVSSLSDVCNKIGTSMLNRGGNAADAVVAAEFCLGVIGMYDTGLGGGGFALIRRPNGTYISIDFRETAPTAANNTTFTKQNANKSLLGGLASGIPGNLRGYQYIYENYCTIPWADLIAPSIDLARNGFVFPYDLEFVLHDDGTVFPLSWLVNDREWALDFAPNGTRLGTGDIMTRRRYANLLQSIAEGGPDVFYEGPIAEATIALLKSKGGIMTMDDLKKYTVLVQEPLHTTYRGFDIHTVGAPSSGAVILNVLKTIEGYEDIGQAATLNLSTYRLNEAIRFGYGARTELADPAFYPNISIYERRMFLPQTGAEIRAKINDSRTQPVSAYNPKVIESLDTPGTSHICAADHTGLAISMTTTINEWFGSGLVVPETGLILNNEMNDFSIPGISNAFGYVPSPVNYVAPGKRPLSSMSPVIIEFSANKTLYGLIGGSGGSYIITAVLEALWHVLDCNMTIQEALTVPRFHDQLVPNQVSLEYAFDNRTVRYLKSKGLKVVWEERESVLDAILRMPNGTFIAAHDSALRNGNGSAV